MEVRCCCDSKLLGWVDVPDINADGWVFHLAPEVRAWHNTPGSMVAVDAPTLRLPISEITVVDNSVEPAMWKQYMALKSNHVPMDVLRRIPGFVEAKGEPVDG